MEAIKTVLFLLVAGFLACAGVLLVVGGADGEFVHEGIVRINHPYPSTFEYFTNPEKRMLWVRGVKECSKSGPGPIDVGTRFREVVSRDGVTTERIYEVQAYSHAKKFVLSTRSATGRSPTRSARTTRAGRRGWDTRSRRNTITGSTSSSSRSAARDSRRRSVSSSIT